MKLLAFLNLSTQLKIICKHYDLKFNGNKDELKKKCYNFLFYSYYVNKIQKKVRNIFITKRI